MIGSRVTVDAPREQKQLGAFGKMSGLSSRLFLSFPATSPLALIFCHLCPRTLARLPLAWKETEKTATQANYIDER